jgi:hypothetical protein
MYIAPIMLLPYVMFRTWFQIMNGMTRERSKPHVRDPLAKKGAGSASEAALNLWAVEPDMPTIALSASRLPLPMQTPSSRRKRKTR